MAIPVPAPADGDRVTTGFLGGSVSAGEQSIRYVLYVPRDYVPERRWPLVLFLHGAGERGDDALPPSQVGIGSAIRMRPERFPCLVLMPQCPTGKTWADPIGSLGPASPEVSTGVLTALDHVIETYSIDVGRVTLTGLSMGGYGTWSLGSRHADRFAALLPVCGGGDPAQIVPPLKSMPVWAFHGEEDPLVPVDHSRRMIQALKAAGNDGARYTEYPGVGHNSWDLAYNSAEAMQWLLAQGR